MRNTMDIFFDQAFGNPWSLMTEMRPATRELFQPRVDVEDTEQAYLIAVDLPGLRKEDVRIDLDDNILTVTGERKREVQRKDGSIAERHYGKFSRSFTLPSTIDTGKVEANLENGVLTIALPKSEAAKPRSIEIQSGKKEKDVTVSAASSH